MLYHILHFIMYLNIMYTTYFIWAIRRKVTYTLHKKSRLVGQSIKEVQTFLQVFQKKFLPYLFKSFLGRLLKNKVTYRAKFGR